MPSRCALLLLALVACGDAAPGEKAAGDGGEDPAEGAEGTATGGDETGGDGGPTGDSGREADTGAPPERSLDWAACPSSFRLGEGVRCASLEVPFRRYTDPPPPPDRPGDRDDDDDHDDDHDDHDDAEAGREAGPGGSGTAEPGSAAEDAWTEPETLALRLIELPAAGETRGTVWVLDGGPGGTGLRLARHAAAFDELRESGFAVRVPMPRGSEALMGLGCGEGGSARGCSTALLAHYGASLGAFSAREAAADVRAWLDAETRSGLDVLWGQSYGSYVAQLVLADAPGAVDGLILDGVLPLDAELEQVNVLADAPLRAFLESCLDQPRCAAETGGDPVGLAERAVAARCGPISSWPEPQVELLLRGMVESDYGALTVPMLAMMARCEAADKAALAAMKSFAAASQPKSSELNNALGIALTMLDLWHPRLSADEVRELEAELLLPGVSYVDLYELEALFAEVDRAPLPEGPVVSAAPVLLFQGARDLSTTSPWAERVAEELEAPAVHLVRLPTGGHVALASAQSPEARSCVSEIIRAFAEDPGAAPDTDCLRALPPVDHDAAGAETRDRSELVFGVPDPWRP